MYDVKTILLIAILKITFSLLQLLQSVVAGLLKAIRLLKWPTKKNILHYIPPLFVYIKVPHTVIVKFRKR